MKPTICFITLGCAKNLVDSENMVGILKAKGFPIASSPEAAEIGIVNTCGFIESAVEESVGMILEISNMKRTGKLKRLFVVGCLVQRFGYKLRKELPEVDGWLGTGEIHRIAEVVEDREADPGIFLIRRPTYLADHETPRAPSSPFYSAYVKIAEGCSHRCTYCTIPGIRGPFRSRPAPSIVAEVETMAGEGVREINLIAQDTTMYGRELEDKTCLEDLLEKLVVVEGIQWIRVLYGHPHGISNRLLDVLEFHDKICSYLDVPLQHINAGVLMRMGRSSNRENPRQLIERVRSRKRPISLRSTLMVGFPGETEDAFRELYDFVSEAEFDHLGVFVYSPEKGTRAGRYPDRLDRKEAEERRDAIMRLQADISLRKHRSMIGEVLPVLIEGFSDETDLLLKGRTATMAPDVDDQVLINKGKGSPGDILPVRIREAYEYDLVGEIVARRQVRE